MRTKHCPLLFLSFAASAMMAAACSSSPSTNNNNNDGSSNSDTGGSNINCTGNLTTGDGTISDFEDGRGAVLQQGTPPRNGGWYAYNEMSATCMETPAAHSDAPPATSLEAEGGRCGSMFAFRFFGTGCTIFAGVGTDLAAPLPPSDDGGAADASAPAADAGGPAAHKTPYDLTNYKAISFWGRLGTTAVPAMSQLVQVKLPMLRDTKVADGGDCMLTEVGADKCSASFGRFFPFTKNWKLYTLDLDPTNKTTGIAQEIWGKQFTWDPKDVTSIQFQALGSATVFDIWIDDVNLIAK